MKIYKFGMLHGKVIVSGMFGREEKCSLFQGNIPGGVKENHKEFQCNILSLCRELNQDIWNTKQE
jgi:hypothetical protein